MILDSNNLGGRKMDLWIRSQEKERLIKPTDLYIEETIDYVNKCSEFDIYALNYANNDIIIGTYQTKERALEVLDDIQNIVNAKTIIKFNTLVPTKHIKRVKDAIDKNSIIELPDYEIKKLVGVIVYEMPEE